MAPLPRPTEGGNFDPPPAGTHPALCYRLIDLGTQQTTYKGESKIQHQILIGWELKSDDTLMEDGRPMSIHRRYTWSMHEKARLRLDLEAWRGLKFQDRDFGPGGWDIKNVLGKSCQITIMHEEREGRTYANIASVSKLMKGVNAGSLVNEAVYLWLDPEGWDQGVFEKLSENLQSTIKKSPEYIELMKVKTASGKPAKTWADELADEAPF